MGIFMDGLPPAADALEHLGLGDFHFLGVANAVLVDALELEAAVERKQADIALWAA
ncbi:hypothetical protein D3C78_1911920 [compost metagenome]